MFFCFYNATCDPIAACLQTADPPGTRVRKNLRNVSRQRVVSIHLSQSSFHTTACTASCFQLKTLQAFESRGRAENSADGVLCYIIQPAIPSRRAFKLQTPQALESGKLSEKYEDDAFVHPLYTTTPVILERRLFRLRVREKSQNKTRTETGFEENQKSWP